MLNKYNVYVVGCNGEVGKAVCNAIQESQDMALAGRYDCIPRFDNNGNSVVVSDSRFFLDNVDVVISLASSLITLKAAEAASEYNVPLVVDTYGLTYEQLYDVWAAATIIPIFKIPDTSSKRSPYFADEVLRYAKYILKKYSPGLFTINDYIRS